MLKDYLPIVVIFVFATLFLACPLIIGFHNDNLIKDFVTHGMDPMVASCVVSGDKAHCALAARGY